MKRPRLAIIGLALLTPLLFAGCVFRQKTSTRVHSFDPHANHYIIESKDPLRVTELRAFLTQRTALLMSSDESPITEGRVLRLEKTTHVDMGCAAAIDARGYFLTASHCVGKTPVHLIFVDTEGVLRVAPTRCVWQGDLRKGEPDLAILHAPAASTPRVFKWAEEPAPQAPVVAVGIAWNERQPSGFEFMGGNIRKSTARGTDGNDARILHDIPIQSGDSGGPLLNLSGRLIGINVEGFPPSMRFLMPWLSFPRSTSERPDPRWVTDLIERDAASQPAEPLAEGSAAATSSDSRS